jgi:hypothetical protein
MDGRKLVGRNSEKENAAGVVGGLGQEGVAAERRREGGRKRERERERERERWSRRALPRACPAVSLENELHNSSIDLRYLESSAGTGISRNSSRDGGGIVDKAEIVDANCLRLDHLHSAGACVTRYRQHAPHTETQRHKHTDADRHTPMETRLTRTLPPSAMR